MTIEKDGGPAFPLKEPLTCDSHGLSIRDYFAAKAMQSLIPIVETSDWMKITASMSYEIADAMLEARKK